MSRGSLSAIHRPLCLAKLSHLVRDPKKEGLHACLPGEEPCLLDICKDLQQKDKVRVPRTIQILVKQSHPHRVMFLERRRWRRLVWKVKTMRIRLPRPMTAVGRTAKAETLFCACPSGYEMKTARRNLLCTTWSLAISSAWTINLLGLM